MSNLTYNENKKTIKEIKDAFKGYCITLMFGTGTKVMYEGTCGGMIKEYLWVTISTRKAKR